MTMAGEKKKGDEVGGGNLAAMGGAFSLSNVGATEFRALPPLYLS